jgi:hypothetical protein
MNTKIKYMYRDADNYKDFTTVVVSGKITKETNRAHHGQVGRWREFHP